VLAAWLAPWRYRVRQEERERELAHTLVQAWATDTLAPFVLRADKSYFFDDSEGAFIAYRVVAGVAIVSGDPIGPPERFTCLVERFLSFARERGWRSRFSGSQGAGCRSTRATGCARFTTATRRSSTRRRSRSTAGRFARCGSRCTASSARGIARACCDRPRSAQSYATTSRQWRVRGAARSPNAAS
jgi:Uncharacterized conserved protein